MAEGAGQAPPQPLPGTRAHVRVRREDEQPAARHRRRQRACQLVVPQIKLLDGGRLDDAGRDGAAQLVGCEGGTGRRGRA